MSGSDELNVVLQSSSKLFSMLKDLYSLGLSLNHATGSLEFFSILFVPTHFFPR